MSTTLTVTDISLSASPSSSNFAELIGYVASDASIIYGCSDSKIRKFSIGTHAVVASVSAPTASFGFGGSTSISSVNGDEFIIFDKANSIFQLWNAATLSLVHDYWSTFSSVIATTRSNICWDQASDSLWVIEGSGTNHIVRYRLTAGTRTTISGVTTGVGILSLDVSNGRIIYCDGTNLGTASTSSDAGVSSVAWSSIATCGAVFNNQSVAPDGFIWASCAGSNFSGHLWKIDPVSLATVGQCGHHNGLAVHIDATGIPVGINNFAFLNAGITDYVLVAGNGFWEGALVDRSTVSIVWNTATTPALTLNGHGLFSNNEGTCAVVASTRSLWAFCNSTGSSTTLSVTEIGIDYGGYTIIGHGVNLNAYENGGAIDPLWPPGNGELIDDLEPLNNWCRANGISVALNQDSQRSAKDLLDELLTVGNSAPVYSGDKLKIIPYDEVSAVGYGAVYVSPTSSGPVAYLTSKDFVSDGKSAPVSFKRKRRAGCDNVVSIEHIDRSIDYGHNVTTECDQMSVALNGPRKGGTLDAAQLGQNVPSGSKSLLCIHSTDVAQKIGSILAKRGAAGENEFSFTLKAEWALLLQAMDLVAISDPYLGLDEVPVRLTSAKEDAKRQLVCTAERFSYGLNHPDAKDTSTATGTLVIANVDPGLVNDPIIFEPPAAMLGTGAGPQVWFLVSGEDPNYGGCIMFVSVDAGATYSVMGSISPATTGELTADFPSHADPDSVNTLSVDLTESNGELVSETVEIADGFADPCYVEGASGYEVICPTDATLTSALNYDLDTYIRRAVQGTTAMDHPTTSRFGVIDGTTFKVDLPSQWIGKTVHLKFAAYNKVGGQQNDLADCTDYTFTLAGGGSVSGTTAVYDQSGNLVGEF